MALFKLEIFKRLGAADWLNRYWLSTLSFTTAQEVAEDIIIAEANFHSDQVSFYQARISSQAEGDNLFQNLPLSITGNVPATTTAGLLPLWNVVKVYFTKDLSRPDYKLYRGVIGEANSDSGTVAVATRNLIDAQLTALATGAEPKIFAFDGGIFTDVTVDPLIRQRQLHRRKARVPQTGLVTS